jgi:hypothetical protein
MIWGVSVDEMNRWMNEISKSPIEQQFEILSE